MDKRRRKGGSGVKPETIVANAISDYMKARDWLVKVTHGNKHQSGFPDLFTAHRKYGIRWIEVKLPTRGKNPFTDAQLESFQLFAAKGVGVWVLVAATEIEYKKLWKPANWYQFLHTPDVSNT